MNNFILILIFCFISTGALAEEGKIVCKVKGLFSKERGEDLKSLNSKLVDIKIENIDFATSLVTFICTPDSQTFKNLKKEKYWEQVNHQVRNNSNHTFQLLQDDKSDLANCQKIELAVGGLDCKACEFGAYRAVYQMDGVERTIVSFKERKLTAWVKPEKVKQEELEKALKNRGVTILSATDKESKK